MKFRKFIQAMIYVVAMMTLAACGAEISDSPTQADSLVIDNQTQSELDELTTFIEVNRDHSKNYYVVYHAKTKVMYVVSHASYTHEVFTLLVNPDGTPLLYEGEE